MNGQLIAPSRAFIMRLIPAIALESVALLACVLLYVYTEHLGWIFAAVAVAIALMAYVVAMLVLHRSEWRWGSDRVVR